MLSRVPGESGSPEEQVEHPLHCAHAPSSNRPRPVVPKEPRTHSFHNFIVSGGISQASRLFIARGQRVDPGIVEKSVVAVSPGEGLRREREGERDVSLGVPHPLTHPLARVRKGSVYLGADAEVMVGDERRALAVARVEPGVEGAEGHARERQRESQEAPGAGSCPAMLSLGRTGQAPTQGLQRQSHVGGRSWGQGHCPFLLLQ